MACHVSEPPPSTASCAVRTGTSTPTHGAGLSTTVSVGVTAERAHRHAGRLKIGFFKARFLTAQIRYVLSHAILRAYQTSGGKAKGKVILH